MNRLRDDVGEDPIAERGIEMLRGTVPTPAMPELKRKVWGAIQQHRLRAAAPQPMRRLRMAAAVAIVLGLAGTAGAMLSSQGWVLPGRARVGEPATARTTGNVRARARASMAAAQPTQMLAPVAAPGAAPELAPAGTATVVATDKSVTPTKALVRSSQKSARPVVRASGVRRATLSAAATPEHDSAREAGREGVKAGALTTNLGAASARERTEVLDALIALRRDHDAERASRLLDGYLSAYPRGVLREEATVLAIEAADARGDGFGARQLARAYQASYPGGRFGTFAREHAAAERP